MPNFKPYVNITRPLNGLMSAIAVYIGSVLIGAPAIPDLNVRIAMIVTFLISSGGMVVNDIFDIHADRINRPNRPIASGVISVNTAYIYSVILFLVGNALAYMYLNQNSFLITVIATILLVAYNSKLKSVMMVGHIVVSLLVAITLIFGGIAFNNTYEAIIPFALLAFLANIGREIFKTIEDAVGDKHVNITTVALKYGVFKAKVIGSIFIIAAVALSIVPYVLGLSDIVYLGFAIIADIIFVGAIAAPMKHASKLVKIGMNVALLAFLLGAWSFYGVF